MIKFFSKLFYKKTIKWILVDLHPIISGYFVRFYDLDSNRSTDLFYPKEINFDIIKNIRLYNTLKEVDSARIMAAMINQRYGLSICKVLVISTHGKAIKVKVKKIIKGEI